MSNGEGDKDGGMVMNTPTEYVKAGYQAELGKNKHSKDNKNECQDTECRHSIANTEVQIAERQFNAKSTSTETELDIG